MKRSFKVKKLRFYHRWVNSLVNWWRSNAVQQRLYRIRTFYTTCYTKIRCYGGPEEGDWYYTHYEYFGCRFTPFGIGYEKAKKELTDKFWIKHDPGDYDGVVCYRERKVGENQTKGKPIYQ
jgi:hypothetical protein